MSTPSDNDSLYTDAKPDRFEHESPLRAFTEFNAEGSYAIGKGFRPSLQHLPIYLDAIERKEGWRLLQVLEPALVERRPPSFVFRRADGFIPALPAEAFRDARERLDALLASGAIPRLQPGVKIAVQDPVMPELRLKIATGLRQVSSDIRAISMPNAETRTEFAEQIDRYAAQLEAGSEPVAEQPKTEFDAHPMVGGVPVEPEVTSYPNWAFDRLKILVDRYRSHIADQYTSGS